VILAGLLPAVAATTAAVLYDSPLLMLTVMLAAAAAGTGPVLLARSRPGTAGPAGVLALVVLLVLVLVATGGSAGELTGALARLLSFAPPIPTEADTLTPPLVVVWAASFAAALLAARGWRLLAAAATVAVLIAALLLVGRAAPAPGWVAPVICLGVAGLTLIRTGERERSAVEGRRWSGFGPILAGTLAIVLIGVGLVLSQGFSGQDRADPRAHYQPPQQRPEPIDPLSRLAGWAKGDSQVLAQVQLSPLAVRTGSQTNAWRWAILDEFDGARWTSSQKYRPTGERLREAVGVGVGPDVDADPVRASLTVNGTLSPWLPTPGAVRQVSGLSVAVDADHDSILQATPSDQPRSYGLVADGVTLDPTNSVDRTEIAGFRAGDPGTGDDAVSAPGLPADLRAIASGFAPAAGTTDGQRALALQDVLREGEFVSDAPPGHLYVRLNQFFTENSAAYLRGTSEQFATAFAVLGRSVGLPTRIVVGFQLPAGVADDVQVTGADMQAWPEVYFAGHGWVRFAPTPKDRGTSAPRTPPKLKDLIPQPPKQSRPTPAKASGSSGKTDVPATSAADPGVSTTAVIATSVAAVLLLVLLVLVVLLGLRLRLRSARRGDPDPSRRVIGAWRELEDAVVLAGSPPRTGSATDLADRIQSRAPVPAGDRPVTELARIANAAAFGPAGALGTDDADRAWQISDRAATDLRRSASRTRRWLWWITPGPLRRR
jgi:transglutaminase-like putative cysteine protease